MTFQKNRAQAHFDANKHLRNIQLKSRQLGFTTYETIDSLDDALFNKNFDSLMVAQDLDTAVDIFDNKVQLAWENLKDPIKNLYSLSTDSARQMKFNFGDGTKSSLTVDNSGRSGTYRRVHITELPKLHAMYPQRAKEVVEGTIPAVPLDGRVDIEGTAQGEQGFFYKTFFESWEKQEKGYELLPVEFKAHFYNWTWDDSEISKVKQAIKDLPSEFLDLQKLHKLTDVQITYYYLKWISLGRNWEALFSEYPTTWEEAFRFAGDKVFSYEKLTFQEQFQTEGEKSGDWSFFKKYNPTHVYGIGADVAEGVGRDSCAAAVWDFGLLVPEIVATYDSKWIKPDKFAYELKMAGEKYGKAIIAPERNNVGITTIDTLKNIYDPNYIYADVPLAKADDKSNNTLGWKTTGSTKPKMFYDFKTALDEDGIKLVSPKVIREGKMYSQKDMEYKTEKQEKDSESTNHFDLLTAAVIGYQMKDFVKKPIRIPPPTQPVAQYYPELGI